MNTKFILLAAAAFALASCSNDGSVGDWNGEIRLTGLLNVQQTGTRAASDIQGAAFDEGERIDVYLSENTTGTPSTTYAQPLVYTTEADGAMNVPAASQPYYPTSGNKVNIYAVYPSGAGDTFAVATDQSTEESYKASDLMYAKASSGRTHNAVPLNFSHLLSKVTVELVSGVGEPDITGAIVELLNVLPEASFTANSDSCAVGAASGTATDITVMTTSADTLKGSAIVIPQTLSETRFIKVTLVQGGELFGSINNAAAGPTLKAGNEYIYTITVNLTGLVLKADISPWTSDGNANGGTATMD